MLFQNFILELPINRLAFFGGIFFGKQQPDELPAKAPRALVIPTVAVTVFLIVEGLMPGPLLDWAMRGLTMIFGGSL